MAVAEDILDISVSENQRILLMTTRYRIFMFATGTELVNSEHSILKRLKKDEKFARQLHISFSDR